MSASHLVGCCIMCPKNGHRGLTTQELCSHQGRAVMTALTIGDDELYTIVPGKGYYGHKPPELKAKSQQIVAQRLLSCLQYLVPHSSRLQGVYSANNEIIGRCTCPFGERVHQSMMLTRGVYLHMPTMAEVNIVPFQQGF